MTLKTLVAAAAATAWIVSTAGTGAGAGLLIRGVTVIPMHRHVEWPGLDVLIVDGRIARVAREIELETGTEVVDGRGKFLIPGLADMHVHIFAAGELDQYLAHGVTLVRNLWGWDMHLDLRSQIEAGTLTGPTIITSGPLIDGAGTPLRGAGVAADAAAARALVEEQRRAGFDLIKVYSRLSPGAYEAILVAASEAGLPVDGHVPTEVGLERVLHAGRQRSMEHLIGYPAHIMSGAAPASWEADIDPGRLSALAVSVAASGVWNCPTIVAGDRMSMTPDEARRHLTTSDAALTPRSLTRMWPDPSDLDADARGASRMRANKRHVVGALHGAGARLLAGTDTGNPFVVPGADLHQELENLVASGLSPYDALRTATANVGEFLRTPNDVGVILPGARADLVLLDANPLLDIRNSRQIAAVIARGRRIPSR